MYKIDPLLFMLMMGPQLGCIMDYSLGKNWAQQDQIVGWGRIGETRLVESKATCFLHSQEGRPEA